MLQDLLQMNPQAQMPPPQVFPSRPSQYPPLDMYSGRKHYQIYGSRDNQQIVLQNRLLYLQTGRTTGRVLTPEEIAHPNFDFIPHDIREAVCADMAKPRPEELPNIPQQAMTPAQRLDYIDRHLEGRTPRVQEFQAGGIISRAPINY